MTLSSPVFRAVATCVVPEASRLDAAQWDEMAAIVGRAMAARPRAIQRQLALFLILQDRRSTRLNSSHLVISYAVFCLKKKKIFHPHEPTETTHASHPVTPPVSPR